MPHLPWQPQVALVTPSSRPSSNVSLLAHSNNKVVEWISTNLLQFAFCFPPEAFGPDILFFIHHKRSLQLILVMVQTRNYEKVDSKCLLMGVQTVMLFWLESYIESYCQYPSTVPPGKEM